MFERFTEGARKVVVHAQEETVLGRFVSEFRPYMLARQHGPDARAPEIVEPIFINAKRRV